jgi:cobalt-zinc-cadmium efflux system protein
MLWLAVLGIVVNSVAAYRMSKNKGVNPRMVMLHLLEDLYGWVAVFAVSIVLMYKPWYFLDSALSILISFVILRGVYKNLKKVALIFLQKFPEEIDLDDIKDKILKLKPVEDVHAIKGLSLDGESFYLRCHIKVASNTSINLLDSLRSEIKVLLKEKNISCSTLEFESSRCNEN